MLMDFHERRNNRANGCKKFIGTFILLATFAECLTMHCWACPKSSMPNTPREAYKHHCPDSHATAQLILPRVQLPFTSSSLQVVWARTFFLALQLHDVNISAILKCSAPRSVLQEEQDGRCMHCTNRKRIDGGSVNPLPRVREFRSLIRR